MSADKTRELLEQWEGSTLDREVIEKILEELPPGSDQQANPDGAKSTAVKAMAEAIGPHSVNSMWMVGSLALGDLGDTTRMSAAQIMLDAAIGSGAVVLRDEAKPSIDALRNFEETVLSTIRKSRIYTDVMIARMITAHAWVSFRHVTIGYGCMNSSGMPFVGGDQQESTVLSGDRVWLGKIRMAYGRGEPLLASISSTETDITSHIGAIERRTGISEDIPKYKKGDIIRMANVLGNGDDGFYRVEVVRPGPHQSVTVVLTRI